MDTIRSMELFVLAVSRNGLSAAGRQLRMSPAAVTRHINALEDRLGVRLLNRSSRSMTLTEAGQEYYVQAQRILQQVASAENRTRELGSSPSGTIRAHSRLFLGSQFIAPSVPEFLARHPNLNLSLMMSNADLNLNDHNLDVDIRLGRPPHSGYSLRKLGDTRRVVVATQAYLDRGPPLDEPAQISDHECLIYTENQLQVFWTFIDRAGRKTDVAVVGRFSSDFGPTLRELALAGVGVAVLPEWSIVNDIEQGRLVRCLPNHTATHFGFGFDNGIYAVFVKGRHIALKTRLFVDFLVELFKRDRGALLA